MFCAIIVSVPCTKYVPKGGKLREEFLGADHVSVSVHRGISSDDEGGITSWRILHQHND